MFGHIRRHQKWLMVIISALVIGSFVIFIDPTTGRRGRGFFGGRSDEVAYLNGRPIGAEEYEQMKREVLLEFRVFYGQWPGQDERSRQMFDAERQTPERIFFVEKIRELNIQVSDDAVTDWLSRVFRDRKDGSFRTDVYQQIKQRELPQRGYTEQDFIRFVRHEAGIEHLFALAGLSGGLVTPREAEALYREQNELISTEAVFFSASNYLAGVQVTPAALEQFYTNNMAEYHIAERVQVGYVKFDTTNYLAEADQTLAQITNLTQRLEALYKQRGADFYKDADGKTMPQDAAIQKIKEEQRQILALTSARKKAGEFMEQLYELYQKQPKQPDNLEKLAAATGNQSAVTEPFTSRETPKGLKVFESFAQAAFALTPEEPMASEPINGEDGAYVIALKKKIPSEVLSLDAVRDKVTVEFRQREAAEAARKAGQDFYRGLTNGLAQNKSFQAVCLEANVILQKPPPFSLSTRSLPNEWEERISLNVLKGVASRLLTGETSRFELTREGGVIVHLLSRQPAEEAKLKAELPAFTASLREERRRVAVNEWLSKEFELAHFTPGSSQKKSGSR